MILGQSAATAAVMAIDGKLAVQDVPYSALRERLLKDGQVLEYTKPATAAAAPAGSRDAQSRRSVVAQRDYRLDACRPPRRDVDGER